MGTTRDSIWSVPGYVEKKEPLDEFDPTETAQTVINEEFRTIPGNNWHEKLNHCLKCKCCMRHQTLRPVRLEPWTDDMAKVDIKILWVNTKCKCDCRHMARFICRQCDDDGNFLPCPTIGPITEDAM